MVKLEAPLGRKIPLNVREGKTWRLREPGHMQRRRGKGGGGVRLWRTRGPPGRWWALRCSGGRRRERRGQKGRRVRGGREDEGVGVWGRRRKRDREEGGGGEGGEKEWRGGGGKGKEGVEGGEKEWRGKREEKERGSKRGREKRERGRARRRRRRSWRSWSQWHQSCPGGNRPGASWSC